MPRRPRHDSAALRKTWLRSRKAEAQFARNLRSLARRCGELTQQMFDPNDFIGSSAKLRTLLRNYAQTLRPWAQTVARRMVLDVQRRDEAFWAEQSKLLARNLKEEIKNAPIGVVLRERTQEAAGLIMSLPLEAAQRIEKFTVEALTNSSRASEVAKEIMRTGHVTKSRAMLIARTETSRTAGLLVRTRAEHVGATHYIWETVHDIDVRKDHRELQGKVFSFDDPPVAGPNNMRYAPGEGPNCFVPDTLVFPADGHFGVFRTHYSGPIAVLVTGESELPVTPNHPILTTRGWVPAHLLKEGDDLIHVPFEGVDAVKLDIYGGLQSFGQVFESSGPSRKPFVGPIDGFYGDITNEEVDVVAPEFNLASYLEPSAFHFLREQMIPNTNGGITSVGVMRCFAQIFKTNLTRLFDASSAFVFGAELAPQLVGLPNGSFFNPSFFQNAVDGSPTTAMAACQCWNSNASEVVSNNFFVRDIQAAISANRVRTQRITAAYVRSFSGHVFTSETVDGYYRVGHTGIIAKNCRCWARIIFDEPVQEFRAEAT
jgi:SPP1 gp7 family putative phage head morphogenesis protein